MEVIELESLGDGGFVILTRQGRVFAVQSEPETEIMAKYDPFVRQMPLKLCFLCLQELFFSLRPQQRMARLPPPSQQAPALRFTSLSRFFLEKEGWHAYHRTERFVTCRYWVRLRPKPPELDKSHRSPKTKCWPNSAQSLWTIYRYYNDLNKSTSNSTPSRQSRKKAGRWNNKCWTAILPSGGKFPITPLAI